MIKLWLDLPVAGVFAALAVLYGVTAAAIAVFVFGARRRRLMRRIAGVVPGYFAAVSVLFALLTGFLANDIGERNRQASRAVQTEAKELRNVFTLSVASASDMRNIRAAWKNYVERVTHDDWPAMESGQPATATNAAYDELLREVSDPKIAAESGAVVHAALLGATVRAGTARSDRIALAGDRTNDLKWAMVLILGVLTQVAIGVVHLQRRGAHVAALLIFSAAVVVALGFIALQELPFEGPIRVEPGPLEELLKLNGPNG